MVKSTASHDARERARQVASKQAKNTKKGSGWIKATVALLAVAIIAIVATVIINTNRNKIDDAGPIPESSNVHGGIVMDKTGVKKGSSDEPSRDINSLKSATASHTVTQGAQQTPLPNGIEPADQAKKNGEPVKLVIFQDYNCVHCAEFERQYGDSVQKLVDEGKVTLEIRNLTFLDAESPNKYSARTANAAYSVANQVDTDKFLEYQKEIFSHQGQGGLSNDEIIDIAKKHGADISEDMKNDSWRSLVNVVTQESSQNGISGTPTIFADGQQYTTTDFNAWIDEIIKAKEKK